MLNEGQGEQLSDEQMDALVNNEAPSRDIPMTKEPAPQVQAAQEYALKVNGQEIKAPLEKVLQWAQMGYNYPQKAAELKAQQDAWQKQAQEKEQQWSEIENKWKPYKEVDEYAAKNPDWWAQVQEQYKQKIAGAESNPEITQLKQELAELKQFREELKSEKTAEQVAREDRQLSEEISAVRKTFSNIDFDTPDEEGKSLEMKVLAHAETMGLDGSKPGQFRAAFRDFYHDHLVNKAEEKGKEKVTQELQKRTKLGILSESSKPANKGFSVATNVRSKSYNDLVQEALSELNN